MERLIEYRIKTFLNRDIRLVKSFITIEKYADIQISGLEDEDGLNGAIEYVKITRLKNNLIAISIWGSDCK